MARDDNQVKAGAPSQYTDDKNGSVTYPSPVLGIVKDNIDPTHNGRIKVYIAKNGGGEPDNSDNWTTVSYASPWFGSTKGTSGPSDDGTYLTNPQSYGFWATAPDVGTQVICIFIEGKVNQGYYIGSLPTPGGHYMVPAIGAASAAIPNGSEATTYGGADRLPVTEINTKNPKYQDSADQSAEPKPVHSYQASILANQGLIRDNVRGVIGSSSMRETPSAVFGISTPGAPIWDGGFTRQNIKGALKGNDPSKFKVVGRTGGHSLVMDDGELFSGRDQMIRLRSAGGHQITMSDDGQVLFITHSNGKTWVELGAEGTVDIFATNSFNVRTQGDINFHADRNINLQAGKDINLASENINIQSTKDTSLRVGGTSAFQTVGAHTHKAGGALSLGAGGDASLAGGTAFINGGKINLNTGQTGTSPKDVPALKPVEHVETEFSPSKGWMFPARKPTKSIASRVPSHQPWALAGKGVDAETPLNPGGDVSQPPAAVQAATETAMTNNAPAETVTPEVAKTVPTPDAQTAGNSVLDSATKQAVIGQNALDVSKLSDAAKSAGGIIPGVAGLKLPQLELSGVLKAGAAVAVGALMARGVSFQKATSDNSFTGQMGVTNANTLVASSSIQAEIAAKSLDNAGLAMIEANVITGNESPTQIAGLVNAVSQTSAGQVAQSLIDNAGSTSTTAAANTQTTAPSSGGTDKNTVFAAIAAGAAAAQVANKFLSGSGGLPTSLSGLKDSITGGISKLGDTVSGAIGDLKNSITGKLDSLKSSAEQAFAAAEASFTNLKGGVPNFLGGAKQQTPDSPTTMAANDYDTAKAEKNQATDELFAAKKAYQDDPTPENLQAVHAIEARIAAADKKLLASSKAFLTASAGGVTSTISGLVNSVKGKLGSSLGSVESLAAQATAAVNGSAKVATTANSGINALPGGLGSMVSKGQSALTGITGSIKSVISGSTSLFNSAQSAASSLGSKLSGGIGDLTGKLTSFNAKDVLAKLDPGVSAQIMTDASAAATNPSTPPTAATGTSPTATLTAKIGALLGDSRIPVPNLKPIEPAPSTTTAQEVNEQVAAKTVALKNIQNEEKALEILKQKYGIDAATNETTSAMIKTQEEKLAAAQKAYDAIVNSAQA